MENPSCLLAIKHNYVNLTPVEKKVADYILANSDKVIYMTTSEFAEKAGVVKSAIVRCCQSLGFKGFNLLKVALTAELSKNKQLNFVPYVNENDTASMILDKIFSANVKTLHDTAENINRKELEAVVDVISKAKSIYIYGVGTSAIFVNDFQYRLMQQGYSAYALTDILTMKVSTINITKDDVAIGISNSGRTASTIDSLKLAKNMGCTTICITSYPKSPITKISDHSLEIYSDELQYPIEAISSRIAYLSITDAIVISLSSLDYEKAQIVSQTTRKLVETIRYNEC